MAQQWHRAVWRLPAADLRDRYAHGSRHLRLRQVGPYTERTECGCHYPARATSVVPLGLELALADAYDQLTAWRWVAERLAAKLKLSQGL